MQTEPRDLSATNTAAAAAATSDLVVTGNPDLWRLVWKTSSRSSASMFSIKHNAARGILQLSWKLGAEVCEELVVIGAGAELVPNGGNAPWPIVGPADDLVYSGSDHFHAPECAAESRALGFRKSTLLFTVLPCRDGGRGHSRTITLVMTEERGKIAMAAALTG